VKRFYLNAALKPDEIVNPPAEIVRHMHALRVRTGELVEFFDGKNRSYQSEVLNLERRNAALKIIRENPVIPVPKIVISLAIAVVANDKMDLIIGKAVELGVRHIIPVYSEYSGRLIEERCANKLAHWQNIIISSCEQCGQNLLPTIDLPIPLNLLYDNMEYDLKVIMNVPSHTANSINFQKDNHGNNINKAILLVGPEGGFTDDEVKDAAAHNYQSLQLGNLIMRAETAAIAGICAINLYLGAWKC
jgi:16S rRNA (uracil1498-N3)-methyltransferase